MSINTEATTRFTGFRPYGGTKWREGTHFYKYIVPMGLKRLLWIT